MAYLNWINAFDTGISLIDEQHRKIVEIINNLHEHLIRGSAPSALGEILEELINYANYHFESEEKFMREIDYPALEQHIRAHEIFKSNLRDLMERLQRNELTSLEILIFVKEWLIKHIIAMDKGISKFLKEKP